MELAERFLFFFLGYFGAAEEAEARWVPGVHATAAAPSGRMHGNSRGGEERRRPEETF